MIIREIVEDTEKQIMFFDYYNDYKDTRSWLSYSHPELLPALDAGYKGWLKEQ